MLRKFSGELAEVYRKIERSEIRNLEEHISKLSYKIAVELAQMNLLMASLLEVSYTDTQKLRGKAVQMVNNSRGYVPLREAIKNTTEIRYMEDRDE
jgi:molybdopterin converting factor small subunit